MKNKNGISLIVLVITILVMIILAGVVIVSLQNDNPINKAKYAKTVDSIQSVRSAISQYTVTAQANENLETNMTKILKNINPETKEGILNTGNEVKTLLGVDPSSLIGDGIGNFIVNSQTGSAIYKIAGKQAMNLGIELDKPLPDGIQIDGVYEALDTYSVSQCLDYSSRKTSVQWNSEHLKENKKGPEWKTDNVIVLIINADNGDKYISYNKVTNSINQLQPLKYWIVK